MAWLPDEQYVLMEDTREKAITARSARHTRTHNGKGGAVKFPSDYLTAKERKKLNGECIKYASLKKPMTWEEFKALPDDLKKQYVKFLRAKYNTPVKAFAEMFGVTGACVSKLFKTIGLAEGKGAARKYNVWDEEGFAAWCGKAIERPIDIPAEETEEPETVEETPVKNVTLNVDMVRVGETAQKMGDAMMEVVDKVMKVSCDNRGAVPTNGTLTFEGKSKDILRTLNDILGGQYVKLSVQWSVEDNDCVAPVTMDTNMLANAAKTIDYALLNKQRRQASGSKG